jgi:hypothetical protein
MDTLCIRCWMKSGLYFVQDVVTRLLMPGARDEVAKARYLERHPTCSQTNSFRTQGDHLYSHLRPYVAPYLQKASFKDRSFWASPVSASFQLRTIDRGLCPSSSFHSIKSTVLLAAFR